MTGIDQVTKIPHEFLVVEHITIGLNFVAGWYKWK